ncbi:TerB family tellurite resistance protein [Hydrogenophaga sp.]|uniref:tellurite resistance TerB family protein n=1 Tax=Hydrogenophaga sp. TaxID=1904254 RepID=UPI0035665238
MLRTLKNLLERMAAPAESPAEQVHTQQLATAVLLIEVMRADPAITAEERSTVLAALRSRFTLTESELEQLVELAMTEARNAYDTQRFTNSLNEHFSHAQKVEMVEAMWQVAYADQHLDAHENHVISKVAGLLHVTHGEYISGKLNAKTAIGPT